MWHSFCAFQRDRSVENSQFLTYLFLHELFFLVSHFFVLFLFPEIRTMISKDNFLLFYSIWKERIWNIFYLSRACETITFQGIKRENGNFVGISIRPLVLCSFFFVVDRDILSCFTLISFQSFCKSWINICFHFRCQ